MTNEELIAEARKVEGRVRSTLDTTVADLVRDLADALEAAGVPYRGGGVNLFRDLGYDESAPAVIAARAGVKLAELIRDLRVSADEGSYDTAELCQRAAEALEAAGNAPVQVDEAKLAEAIAEELETDDAIAEEWSSGKLGATARQLVQFAVLPVLWGGGR